MSANGSISSSASDESESNSVRNVLRDDVADVSDFDLPDVGRIPTLEEILAEHDDGSYGLLSAEEFSLKPGIQYAYTEGSDAASVTDTIRSEFNDKKKDWKKPQRKVCKSDQLRLVKLRSISAILTSAKNDLNLDSGSPTVLAVGLLMAVGTTHGIVFVFDHEQKLKFRFGSTTTALEFGNVSALDFFRDGSRLLVGYGRGQIRMYDTLNGKLLRTLTADEAHSVGQVVVHLRFTNDKTVAVCSDTGGSVFELNFTRQFGRRGCQTRCIFSGCKGEVSIIAPLILPQEMDAHSAVGPLLIAMGSLTKVIVARLRPKLRVVFACALTAAGDTLPMIAWNFVPVQFGERSRIVDPVLLFGREHCILFYHCSVLSGGEAFKFVQLQRIDLPGFRLINLCWLNVRSVLVLDSTERLHLYDVRSGEHLEVMDCAQVELVYGTSDFKGWSTGGNVSQALAFAAEHACYHSLVSISSGQAFMLGMKSVEVISLRSWHERLSSLEKDGDCIGAIQLALDFYDGKAKFGLSMPDNVKQRANQRALVSERLTALLISFVDLSLTKNCPAEGKIDLLAEHFKYVVPLCIDTCIKLKRLDLLFDQIYPKFAADCIAHGFFLECLEDYILDERVTSVPPIVVQAFVGYMEREGLLSTIESCIVRLDVASLDIHQVMTTCRRHGLYDGIIYVYNNALKDYTTPLKEMFPLLQKTVQKELLTDEDIKLGNRVLLYISCCLCGRAYPVGELPEEEAELVSNEVYRFITSAESHTITVDERQFPYLRTLLKFDTREFLNVMAMAFDSPEFQQRPSSAGKAQDTIDILVKVMLENNNDFSTLQTGALFTFLCRLIVSKPDRLFVRRDRLHQLLEASLCCVEDGAVSSSSFEKQQALLELLQASESSSLLDKTIVLRLAENAQLYQVCEWIYWQQRNFEKIIECHLKDPFHKAQALTFVKQTLAPTNDKNLSPGELSRIKQKFVDSILEFVAVDVQQTAEILVDFAHDSIVGICRSLFAKERESLHSLLSHVYEYRRSKGELKFVDENPMVNDEISETFIRLVCQFNRMIVASLLQDNETFCTEPILKICSKAKADTAVIFLLEHKGRIQDAFEHMFGCLRSALDAKRGGGGDLSSENPNEAIANIVVEAIAFCRRNSDGMPAGECEAMWFKMFDAVLLAQRQRLRTEEAPVKGDPRIDFRTITSNMVNAMINFVDASVLLQKLFDDPLYHSGKYGEFEPLLSGIFGSYAFDEILLEKTVSVIKRENYDVFRKHKTKICRPIRVTQRFCSDCIEPLEDEVEGNSRAVVFQCGHCFHVACLQRLNSFTRDRRTGIDWLCAICKDDVGSDKDDGDEAASLAATLSQLNRRRATTLEGSRKMNERQDACEFIWTPERFAFLRQSVMSLEETANEQKPKEVAKKPPATKPRASSKKQRSDDDLNPFSNEDGSF